VASAGSGDDKETEGSVAEHGLDGAIGCDAGIALGGEIRVPLDHGCQFQAACLVAAGCSKKVAMKPAPPPAV